MMVRTVTSVDIYGKTYQVPISELQWRPSAYGIIINNGKVLLSPQFSDNRYDLPGGGVDLGEAPQQAVVREVKEETGLDVANPKIVGEVSRFFTFSHTAEKYHAQSVMLYYLCDLVGGELSVDGLDKYEKEYAKLAVWLPIADLDSIEIASTYDWRELIKKVASR